MSSTQHITQQKEIGRNQIVIRFAVPFAFMNNKDVLQPNTAVGRSIHSLTFSPSNSTKYYKCSRKCSTPETQILSTIRLYIVLELNLNWVVGCVCVWVCLVFSSMFLSYLCTLLLLLHFRKFANDLFIKAYAVELRARARGRDSGRNSNASASGKRIDVQRHWIYVLCMELCVCAKSGFTWCEK